MVMMMDVVVVMMHVRHVVMMVDLGVGKVLDCLGLLAFLTHFRFIINRHNFV